MLAIPMANPPRRTVASSPSRGRAALLAAIAVLIVVCGLAFALQGDAEVAMASGAGDATEQGAVDVADAGASRDESQRAKAVDATDDPKNAKTEADGALTAEKRTRNHVRIRVIDVLELLAAGESKEQILEDFPDLEADDIAACLLYAARRLDHPNVAA